MPLPLKWRGKKFPAEAETQMAEKREGRGDQNTIEFLPRAEQVSLNRKMALWSQLMRWKMGKELSSSMECWEPLLNCSFCWVRNRACLVWALRSSSHISWGPRGPVLGLFPGEHQCGKSLQPSDVGRGLPLPSPTLTCPHWPKEASRALISAMIHRKIISLFIWWERNKKAGKHIWY